MTEHANGSQTGEAANDEPETRAVVELQGQIAQLFHGKDMGECMAALLRCVESGATSSENPLFLPLVIQHMRGLADHLETQRLARQRPH